MARPTKYSEELAAAICKDIERGNTIRVAYTVNGVPERTFYDWVERYPQFAQAVKVAESKAESLHVGNIVREATAGQWTASAWWLERRRHDDWRKPVERQEISGPEGKDLTVKVLKGVSMEDL